MRGRHLLQDEFFVVELILLFPLKLELLRDTRLLRLFIQVRVVLNEVVGGGAAHPRAAFYHALLQCVRLSLGASVVMRLVGR